MDYLGAGKRHFLQNLFCAAFVTFVFSFRWRNCLPFSGYMPYLSDGDKLETWVRYIIYAKEPFGFPLGLIRRLSFPFLVTNITKGPEPLFAILFKFISRIHGSFSEFYYLVLVELLYVFIVGYVTCLILDSFKVKSFWSKLLAAVLVSLSFPLLHRSSNYFGLTMIVAYFPLYLAFAYFYIRIYKYPNRRSFFFLVLFFAIAAFFDYYPLIGIFFIFSILLCFNLLETILYDRKINCQRINFIAPAFALGIVLSIFVLFILGNQGNLSVSYDQNSHPLSNRYSYGWGYGGGYGGGFHVADVMTLFIPPEDNKSLPFLKNCGPSSYLAKIGFPLTTGNLQDGQYEGFSYLGTTTIAILLFLIIANLSLIRNFRRYFMKFKLCIMSQYFIVKNISSLSIMFGISTFLLYVLSWGYILHIGGVRLNNIATPSLFLAMMLPKFVLVRAMGRLAFPFMLFIIIAVVIWLDRFLSHYIYHSIRRQAPVIALTIILITLHISEIKGYLKPPEVKRGNEIANIFGREDQALIKELLQNKKALIIAPGLRNSLNWSKICYSLAFYSQIPLSDSYRSIGLSAEYKARYNLDIKCILEGNVKEIIDRYGDIAIAVPFAIAEKVLMNANMPLKPHKLQDQNVVILTLDR